MIIKCVCIGGFANFSWQIIRIDRKLQIECLRGFMLLQKSFIKFRKSYEILGNCGTLLQVFHKHYKRFYYNIIQVSENFANFSIVSENF